MPTPTLPAPRTWSSGQLPKAPYLRADVADAIALLAQPPLFSGAQTVTAQNIPTATDTLVGLDTEYLDSLSGHQDNVTNNAQYYGMFAGWYLAEFTVPLNYIGGAGALSAEIAAVSGGAAQVVYGGQRIPNSGAASQYCQPTVSKLIQLTNVGTWGSGDYIAGAVIQSSGGSQLLLNSGRRAPTLNCKWIGTGAASSLAVPTNDAWPVTGIALTAAAPSGATSITVSSTTGMIVGGTLGLDVGTSTAETVTITSISGTTVGISPALAHSHAGGVAVPVSAAFMNKNVRDAVNFLINPPVMEYQYNAGTATLASQSVVPSPPGGPGTTIGLGTKVVDNYSAFNNTSNTWTAPAAGLYYCYGQVALQQGAGGTAVSLAAGLTVTSANYNSGTAVTIWGGTQDAYAAASFVNCAIVRRRLRLNAGDTVQLAGFQNDSATAAATIQGTATNWTSRLITVWQAA